MFTCWKWRYFSFLNTPSIKLKTYFSVNKDFWIRDVDDIFVRFFSFQKYVTLVTLNKTVKFLEKYLLNHGISRNAVELGLDKDLCQHNNPGCLVRMSHLFYFHLTLIVTAAAVPGHITPPVDMLFDLTLCLCINFSDFIFQNSSQENLSDQSWANTPFSVYLGQGRRNACSP